VTNRDRNILLKAQRIGWLSSDVRAEEKKMRTVIQTTASQKTDWICYDKAEEPFQPSKYDNEHLS